ncbi:intracellular growth attenuator family protein [Yersinia mollaretii]|uniref:intracellular growth attenuator family protein n=1 Tax=Yersinia mollaretii TaxID=33060 RepID=UPI0005E9DBDE|nr:intracellular growth attenuator family protein [Yersinia mollaretii]PJE86744.1 intracellular growth attenuator family protein [Yersinia mollaretii]CQD36637.1 intracellular growth attenuator family protein [Yersinia mollaretii]CQH24179.1 intracellular growth attenuator family protein [Yersinia mollaretii]
MSTIVLILALLLTSLIAVGLLWWFKFRPSPRVAATLPFAKPTHRTLTPEERVNIENYLLSQHENSGFKALSTFDPNTLTNRDFAPEKLVLTPQSEKVYSVTRAITRYGVASDEPNKWRYYLDSIEVHLPSSWEQYITQDNDVELIQTQSIPLVISLNGHTLKNHQPDNTYQPIVPSTAQNASIRKADSEHIELLNIRKETAEEYALHGANDLKEAIAICLALLILFFALIGPAVTLPWLVIVAATLIGWACWNIFRPLSEKDLREVHCLSGTPKRWGLFGESNQGQMSNISLGVVDLIYPAHWGPYFAHDLGKKTNIDIYLNRQVIRQGRFLSLHDEMKHFPLQRWGKNLTLMAGSLLVMALLLIYVPLGLPLKLSVAWLQGAQSQQVTSVEALEKMPLRIGDMLKAQGTGMCYVPPNTQNPHSFVFTPFDCSGIYWNNAAPLPLPESDTIERAASLMASVTQQLHPQGSDANVNPQLATAIEKSGMILLDNFADIVLKTQALCGAESDCIRLKNALVNLGNAKNWSGLVKRAQSGTLKGMNVLLRPVSADTLESLVKTATSSFVYRETHLATEALNSPPPGGFLITSDEGKQLVNHPAPAVPLFDYSALEQWRELQRLSGLLLNTPFKAEGIITNITIDANGTRHIALHSEPDMMTLSRYLGTSLLLLTLIICLVVNTTLLIQRVLQNRSRMDNIQRYYDNCFNQTLTPAPFLR